MDIWETIATHRRNGTACVVVTVVEVRGSVPGQIGAKAVITTDGVIAGTLGGGRVEARAIDESLRLLETNGEGIVEHRWNLQRDIGMTCGGEMRFLFEIVRPCAAWHIAIFGAGHVAHALATVLQNIACRVDIIDPRRDWLDRLPAAPNLTPRHVTEYAEGIQWITEKSFAICITKGHTTDRPVLRALLQKRPPLSFIGVIGSASKRAVLARELTEDGLTAEELSRMVCPLGLPIGTNDPAEIAISIVAQLLEKRGGRAP